MNSLDTRPGLSVVSSPDPTSPETEVRTRVFAWCSSWSSINGRFVTGSLREIATDGPIRMVADLGHHIAVGVSLDGYAAYWSRNLTEAFAEWFLLIDSPIEVSVSGNMAKASFHTRLQGVTHDQRRKSQRQHTQHIFEKRGGTWRLVQERMIVSPEGTCF